MKMEEMQLISIPIGDIIPNPYQPREAFSEESIKALAESMGHVGLLQPIIVREHEDRYQIICGERRWRAAQFAGEKTIHAIVKQVSDKYMLLESLLENIHRDDLTSIEHENAIYELWISGEYETKRELAKILGYAERHVGDVIGAKEFRDKTEASVSTRTITDTAGLDDESRKKIIRKVEEKKLEPSKVREVSRTLKSALPEARQLILDEDIDIGKAKTVIESVKDEAKQVEAINDIAETEKELKSASDKSSKKKGKALQTNLHKTWVQVRFIQPNQIMDYPEEERKASIKFIRQIYNHTREILIACGEIPRKGGL